MNLSTISCEELELRDQNDINGGDFGTVAAVIGIVWFGIEAYNNREAIARGFKSVM